MPIEVRCSCGQVYHADPDHAGRSIRCRCGKTLPIPAPAEPRRGKRASRRTVTQTSGTGAARRHLRARLRLPTLTLSPRLRRIVHISAWAYLALALLCAGFLWTEADQWWPATVLMFSPRWLFLLPAAPLGLAALLVRPRLLLPVAAATLIVIGPVMGYRTGWRGWLAGSRPHDLRLITFNVDGGANPRLLEIPGALRSLGADVLAFQECPEELADPARWPAGWSVRHTEGSLCLATRFPIQDVRVIPYVEVGDQGGTGNAAFFRLTAGTRTIDLVVVHLETVRKGLSELRYASDPGRMEDNLLVRGVGARRVRRWLDQQSREPIVAGDFNMPVESRIYRDDYGDCANAFSTTGHGFGYTRVLKRFSARIDHVVACGGWTPLSARVGPDVGSDHLPLIVDLAYSRQAGRKP